MSKKDNFNVYRDIFGVRDYDLNGKIDYHDALIKKRELEEMMRVENFSSSLDDYDDLDYDDLNDDDLDYDDSDDEYDDLDDDDDDFDDDDFDDDEY